MRKWKDLTRDEKFVAVISTAAIVGGTCCIAYDICKSLKVLKHLKSCRMNLEACDALVDSTDVTDRLFSMYYLTHGIDDIDQVADFMDVEEYHEILNAYAASAKNILTNPVELN